MEAKGVNFLTNPSRYFLAIKNAKQAPSITPISAKASPSHLPKTAIPIKSKTNQGKGGKTTETILKKIKIIADKISNIFTLYNKNALASSFE